MSVVERVDHQVADGSLRAAVFEAGRQWATGQRDLIVLVRDLDASREWAADGEPSCAHWVAAALDIEISTAREWLRIGKALVALDVIAGAFAEGRLSYSKVRSLTRVATVDNQAELCTLAERVPAGRLGHAVGAWLARHETPEQTEARHNERRSFAWWLDVDGMVVGSFRLSPADAVRITTPVDALVVQRRPEPRCADASADASGNEARWPSIPQQRADALVELFGGGGASSSVEIVMHVRADGCSLDDGTPMAGSVVERLVPDAFLRALIHDAESRPINASGKQRHPTARQRRVVQARDCACVDCGATEFLQYDHEPDHEQSGQTVVDELRLRCWSCHRARHRRQRRAA
jgi:hypothetical protein